jgi:hypothetical protein
LTESLPVRRHDAVVDEPAVVCPQPVAAPAVFELGLVYPCVKTARQTHRGFDTNVDKARPEEIIAKESIVKTTPTPLSMVSINRHGSSTAVVCGVLSCFHRVTLVEHPAGVRKFQRGALLEYKPVGLLCDQLDVDPCGAVDLML